MQSRHACPGRFHSQSGERDRKWFGIADAANIATFKVFQYPPPFGPEKDILGETCVYQGPSVAPYRGCEPNPTLWRKANKSYGFKPLPDPPRSRLVRVRLWITQLRVYVLRRT